MADLKRNRAKAVAAHLALAGSKQWRAELRESLARFSGPVRIITGSDDPITPEAVGQLESLPNVELISVPGAGHHPQLTHGDALVGLINGMSRANTAPEVSTADRYTDPV